MSSLVRGFKILELVANNQDRGVTFPEILQRTGYPNSSCFRILKELTELNYLRLDKAERRYFVSLKIAGIGGCVMKEYSITKIARPFMEKLFEESGQTCNLGILGKDTGIFVDVLYATSYGIKLLSEAGNPFPLHCTALGKVLLAHADASVREAVLHLPLQVYTERTTTDRKLLEQELAEITVNGYSIEHEETTRGIECVAAPIFDYRKTNIAAVSVATPFFVIEAPSERERIRNLVITYAGLMSEAFGYRPDY